MKNYPAYISKHNSNHEKQILLLMNANRGGWYYPAVDQLCALFRGITSEHGSNFYCLNCLHSFRSKNKFKSHKKFYENKVLCGVVIPSEDTKVFVFNQYWKSEETPSR